MKVLEVKLPEPKLGNRNSPTAGSAVSTKLLVRAHTSRVCRMIRKQCRKFDCVSSAQLERVVRSLALPQVVMAIEQTAQLGKVDRRKGVGTDGALGNGRSLSRSGSQSCLKREDRGRARALAEKKMSEMQARELKRKEESKWEEHEGNNDEEKVEKEQRQQQQEQIEHEEEDKENVQTPTFQGCGKSNLRSASENGKRDRNSMKDLAKRLEDHFGAVIPRQLNFKNYGRPRGSDTVADEASEQKTQDRAEKRALRERMPQQPEREIPREPRNGGGRGRRRRNRRRRVRDERL